MSDNLRKYQRKKKERIKKGGEIDLINKLERIAEKTGQNLPQIFDEYLDIRLRGIFCDYLEIHKQLNDLPSRSRLRNKLLTLGKACERFQAILNQLEPIDTAWLGSINAANNKVNPFEWLTTNNNQQELENLIAHIDNIKNRTERATDFLKSGIGGRTKDISLSYFINSMAYLWKQSTGKKPSITYNPVNGAYGGDFVDFLYECLKNLGHTPHSKAALAKAIQRTLT